MNFAEYVSLSHQMAAEIHSLQVLISHPIVIRLFISLDNKAITAVRIDEVM